MMMMMMMPAPSEADAASFNQITKLSSSQLLAREPASSSSSARVRLDDAAVLAHLRLLPGALREALVSTLARIVMRRGRRLSGRRADFFKAVRDKIAKQLSDAAKSRSRCDAACIHDESALVRLVGCIAYHTSRLARICATGLGDVTAEAFLMLPAASSVADQQPFAEQHAVSVVGFYATLISQPRPRAPKTSQGSTPGSSSSSSIAARMEVAGARFQKQIGLLALLASASSVAKTRLSIGGEFTADDFNAEMLRVVSRDNTALTLLDDEYDIEKLGPPLTVNAWWAAAMRASDSVGAAEAAARRRRRESSVAAVTRESSVAAVTRERSAATLALQDDDGNDE